MMPIPAWLVDRIRADAWIFAVLFGLAFVSRLAQFITEPAWFDLFLLQAYAFIVFQKLSVLRYVHRSPR